MYFKSALSFVGINLHMHTTDINSNSYLILIAWLTEYHIVRSLIKYQTINSKNVEGKNKNSDPKWTLKFAQLQFLKILAVSVLKYECKNWGINRSDETQIESTEIKFIKAVITFALAT
jgi:hypothetical protein